MLAWKSTFDLGSNSQSVAEKSMGQHALHVRYHRLHLLLISKDFGS